jgi:autotransporter adhesin
VQSGVVSLSTSLGAVTKALASAAGHGASTMLTVVGAGGTGIVETQGATTNGSTLTVVNASDCTSADGYDSTANGVCARAGSSGATAYGSNAIAGSENATAIGFRATAANAGSVAIGYQARAIGDPTTAVGTGSAALANNAVAIGAGATALATNSVALGTNSIANSPNSVSVGSVGNERTISNVAPGLAGTDAINVNQLNDAVVRVQSQITQTARAAYAGIAAATALGMIPGTRPGDVATLGMGVATYRGYQAVAVGMAALISRRLEIKGCVGFNADGVVAGFGAGWHW